MRKHAAMTKAAREQAAASAAEAADAREARAGLVAAVDSLHSANQQREVGGARAPAARAREAQWPRPLQHFPSCSPTHNACVRMGLK